MKTISLGFCASVLAASVAARAVPDTHVLHERHDATFSPVLAKRGRADAGLKMPMRIGLKQSNLDQAEKWLMEVSDPRSAKYGQHWTQQQVIDAFAPSTEAVDSVAAWLHSAGIDKRRITHSDNKQWLAFEATTEEAESLLHTDYHEYQHPAGHALVGTDEYHIPKHLQSHIDYITPGVKRSVLGTRDEVKRAGRRGPLRVPAEAINHKNKTDLSTCDQQITPACIQALYDFQPWHADHKVDPSNRLGVFELGDFYDQGDLNDFFTQYTPYIANGTHPILDSVDGGEAPVPQFEGGGESTLDFELAFPIVFPQNITLFQTDDLYYSSGQDPNVTGIFNTFLDAIDGSYCTFSAYGETGDDPNIDPSYPDGAGYDKPLMCGVYKPTNVISMSYGGQESDYPVNYQKRQCLEFAKLGLMGTSVFVASGDDGVAGPPYDDSENGCLANGIVFSPAYPNNCPWITNVGATSVQPGQSVYEVESAVYDPEGQPFSIAFYSGGGFSNIYPIPAYQAEAVANYFQNHDPGYAYYYNGSYQNSTGLYNRNGRAYPDEPSQVAANGNNIATWTDGDFSISGGTSASTPIFASLINRIVDDRLLAGKKPLGFINPVLYQEPHILSDVINGTNPGCGTTGFACAPGWDPVSGLGTPNYIRMYNLFMRLP